MLSTGLKYIAGWNEEDEAQTSASNRWRLGGMVTTEWGWWGLEELEVREGLDVAEDKKVREC